MIHMRFDTINFGERLNAAIPADHHSATMNKTPETPLSMEPGHPDDGADLHIAPGRIKVALPPNLASRVDQMFPKLMPAEIDRLRRFGIVKTWQPGELLAEAGKPG